MPWRWHECLSKVMQPGPRAVKALPQDIFAKLLVSICDAIIRQVFQRSSKKSRGMLGDFPVAFDSSELQVTSVNSVFQIPGVMFMSSLPPLDPNHLASMLLSESRFPSIFCRILPSPTAGHCTPPRRRLIGIPNSPILSVPKYFTNK